MKVKIWGSRGSLPSPLTPVGVEDRIRRLMRSFVTAGHTHINDIEKFLSQQPRHSFGGYGGNTSCLEVSSDNQMIVIDGGSGLRLLGYELMNGPCAKGQGEVHIFFTHFHWDHLIGLPFFTPIFIPGNKIHVYSPQPELADVFKTLFRKPFFPVSLESLGAVIQHHYLEPRKPFKIGDMTITPYQLDHPDPCWGYKIQSGGKTYSHCVDTECTRVSREQLGLDLPLYQGVDLMIFDAQYTLMETLEKVNWGHAAATFGLDIAMREGVKQVLFMHHDPASSDEKIAAAEAQARRYYDGQMKVSRRNHLDAHEVQWGYIHDGMIIDV